MNLHDLATQREALREEKRKIAEREKELNAAIADIDTQLFDYLDEQGVDRISSNGITLSISENVVPQVTDWNDVYNFVQQTGHFQLFERRMSSTAFRELLAYTDGHIPGVQQFTKRTINMRVSR